MTKLEWCRANAPECVKNEDDESLLSYMSSAYERFCTESNVDSDVTDLRDINEKMDIMVTVLTRALGDKIAFKGGYMLTKLIPEYARQTEDIDFSIQNSELYADLLVVMDKLGKHFIEKGYIDHYVVKPEVRERMSGGMDMYDADNRKVLGIDIGWHDITFGTTTTSIDVGEVRAFTVERMLADKITAILSRKRFRRTKDIYDLYCITNCFDFNVDVVNDYILRRTDGKGAEWENFPFNEIVVREYTKAYNKLKLQSIVKDKELPRPDFTDVLYRFNDICRFLLSRDNKKYWNHVKSCFEVRK